MSTKSTKGKVLKWKQKSFAEGVNREVIENGAAMLNTDLDYVIEQTIEGMKKVASEIGLEGNLEAAK